MSHWRQSSTRDLCVERAVKSKERQGSLTPIPRIDRNSFCVTETQLAIPSHAEWPKPESSLLAGVVAAIRARSGAIYYRVAEFIIEIADDNDDGVKLERLNLRMQDLGGNPSRLSLAFWNDGMMWLDCRQSSKVGWNYEITFHATITDIAPNVVCDMIEQSLWITEEEQMESVWSHCKPFRE